MRPSLFEAVLRTSLFYERNNKIFIHKPLDRLSCSRSIGSASTLWLAQKMLCAPYLYLQRRTSFCPVLWSMRLIINA